MDLETYQDLGVDQEPADAAFATIGQVYGDGVSLIFDGQESATQKHYKCNRFGKFSAGDRVKIIRDSNTYVVEYPVGAPQTSLTADYATSAGRASNATNASYAARAGTADSAMNATNASKATQATLAMRVSDGGSSTSYYVLLRYHSGYYWIKSSMTGNWSKITTTT